MSFRQAAFLGLLLAATVEPSRAQPPIEPEGLTRRETVALAKGLYVVKAELYKRHGREAIMREVVLASPSLSTEERERIDLHLLRDVETRRRTQEVLNVVLEWRRFRTERFVYFWNPRQRGPSGLPSRGPAREEVARLEELVTETAARFGIEAPWFVPLRIDPGETTARAFPRDDLRWGITTPTPWAPEAVVQLTLMELGGVPYLHAPLGLLHGTCRDDPDCREAALSAAHDTLAGSGHVDILTGLRAGAIGTRDDPAFASALVVVDLLERQEGGLQAISELLRTVEPGRSVAELRRIVRAATGHSPRRLDRQVLAEVRTRALSRAGHLADRPE